MALGFFINKRAYIMTVVSGTFYGRRLLFHSPFAVAHPDALRAVAPDFCHLPYRTGRPSETRCRTSRVERDGGNDPSSIRSRPAASRAVRHVRRRATARQLRRLDHDPAQRWRGPEGSLSGNVRTRIVCNDPGSRRRHSVRGDCGGQPEPLAGPALALVRHFFGEHPAVLVWPGAAALFRQQSGLVAVESPIADARAAAGARHRTLEHRQPPCRTDGHVLAHSQTPGVAGVCALPWLDGDHHPHIAW